jgi:alkaline phosphatase
MVEHDKTPERICRVVRQHWGIEIGDDEARQILAVAARDKDNPHNAFGEVLCPKHTVLGWTTHGHCGGDVPLFAYGPGKPAGLYDAPQIGAETAKALGLDLAQLNQRLFVEAAQAIPGGKVTIDRSDKANPVVVLEYQGRRARLPVNKNLLQIEGNETALEGVVVYAPNTGRVYLPAQAIRRLVGR